MGHRDRLCVYRTDTWELHWRDLLFEGRKWRDFSEGAVVEWVAPSAQRGRCSSLWIYIDECRPSVLASMIELERS